MNAKEALNVTTKNVNMAKMGATKAFLNRYDNDSLRSKTLVECFPQSCRENGTAARIGSAIVETYDDFLYQKITEVVTNQDLANALTEEMTHMLGAMDI